MERVRELTFKMKYAIEKQYLTPNTKRRSGIEMEHVGFIVAHDTGNDGSTARGNVDYYENSRNEKSASAHTFIDDTHIIECIPATTGKPEKAWHVLYDKPLDNKLFGDDANDIAIGVELCYGGKINNKEAYKRYVWYMAYLCYKFQLNPRKHIVGHCDLDPERKLDPTKNAFKKIGITWAQFINDVVAEYNDCIAQPKPQPAPIQKPTPQPVEGDDEVMKLEAWQFEMLAQALADLKAKGFLTDDVWVEKAKNKTLTNSELAFVNTIILQRKLAGA